MAENVAHRRTLARLAAVQALYQMEQARTGVDTIVLEFRTHRLGGEIDGVALHDADDAFFEDIVRGVVRTQDRLDPFIERRLAPGWKLTRINSTSRAILRAGLYELASRPDVPHAVIADEYIELAKSFFDEREAGFINGVLDAAAQDLRAEEKGKDAATSA
ncbi:MAG: transcription antitermination factor NusB [Alphaproteobacteria bacterium]|nr:transcription antitermination factor NusB [Alphaproteobacteria bacterium]